MLDFAKDTAKTQPYLREEEQVKNTWILFSAGYQPGVQNTWPMTFSSMGETAH